MTAKKHEGQRGKETKHRFNLELTQTAKEQIDKLQHRTHADSMTQVIRRALAVFDTLVGYQERGFRLVIRNDATGEEEKILLL